MRRILHRGVLVARPCRRGRLAATLAVALAVPSLVVVPLAAQSISPPLAEYQERARSSFQLSNETLFPMTVVLDVKGFRVTEAGEVVDAPLDTSNVRVKLSAMSFRIPPRGTYTVFYEATATSTPAWFNILSAMSGARTEQGLNVRILLPHVVYLNGKQPLRREDVALRAVELDTARGVLRVQMENLGPHLGRVLQIAAADSADRTPAGGGFPLFPKSRRWTELPWPRPAGPMRLTIRFAKFAIDTTLTPTRGTIGPPP